MSHILPESQSVIDQLKHDFVKNCTPALEQFQLDQNVQQAEAAVKLKYCMMHGLSPDEVTVSSSEDEHGVRTFTITETPSTPVSYTHLDVYKRQGPHRKATPPHYPGSRREIIPNTNHNTKRSKYHERHEQ